MEPTWSKEWSIDSLQGGTLGTPLRGGSLVPNGSVIKRANHRQEVDYRPPGVERGSGEQLIKGAGFLGGAVRS